MTTDYRLAPIDAAVLLSMCESSTEDMAATFADLFGDRLNGDGAALLGNVVALARSVIANHDEMMRTVCLIEGGSERDADMLNLPSLRGALSGVVLADGVAATAVCDGCAFRLGSCANQSASTTSDATEQMVYTLAGSDARFCCHEWDGHVDTSSMTVQLMADREGAEEGAPTCRGFALKLRQARADGDHKRLMAGLGAL